MIKLQKQPQGFRSQPTLLWIVAIVTLLLCRGFGVINAATNESLIFITSLALFLNIFVLEPNAITYIGCVAKSGLIIILTFTPILLLDIKGIIKANIHTVTWVITGYVSLLIGQAIYLILNSDLEGVKKD